MPTNNVCKLCGQPYDFRLEMGEDSISRKWCRHDENSKEVHFGLTEQRIIKNLPKGQVLVKGSDGFSRICDVTKKK